MTSLSRQTIRQLMHLWLLYLPVWPGPNPQRICQQLVDLYLHCTRWRGTRKGPNLKQSCAKLTRARVALLCLVLCCPCVAGTAFYVVHVIPRSCFKCPIEKFAPNNVQTAQNANANVVCVLQQFRRATVLAVFHVSQKISIELLSIC